MHVDGMIKSKIELMDLIDSVLKKEHKVMSYRRENLYIASHIPERLRKADFAVDLEHPIFTKANLVIQSIHQEGRGTACYKFEHYLRERNYDLDRKLASVIVVSGTGMPESYLRYMLCHGVVYSAWFETWLNLFVGNYK